MQKYEIPRRTLAKQWSPAASRLQPMPILQFHFGSLPDLNGIQMAAWALTATEMQAGVILPCSRFPKRNLHALPEWRQQEHHAVDSALLHLGFSAEEYPVIHLPNGAPRFQGQHADLELSISHSRHPELGIIALVATRNTAQKSSPHTRHALGCDVEYPRETLNRIAPRIFTPHEQSLAQDLEDACPLWGIKEAVWKGFGPDLDFNKDIEFLGNHIEPGAVRIRIKGCHEPQWYAIGKAKAPWPWWSVIGPL